MFIYSFFMLILCFLEGLCSIKCSSVQPTFNWNYSDDSFGGNLGRFFFLILQAYIYIYIYIYIYSTLLFFQF